MSKFELGRFDRTVYDHGQTVVQEMRNVTGIKGGEAHFVTAAVYVDGYLQFAGANVAVGIHIDRLAAKHQAMLIIGRMEPNGEIDIKKPHEPSAGNKVSMREALVALVDYYQTACHSCMSIAPELHSLVQNARAALATPPRNCDRKFIDRVAMYDEFKDWCNKKGHTIEPKLAYDAFDWLLATKEGGEK